MQNPLLSPKFPLLRSFYFRDSLAEVKSQAMQQFKTMTKPQPHHFKTVNSIWSAYNVIHHVTLKMVKMDNGQTLVMAS